MHVVRPRRAGLARERAEHPLVAGERAGVGRGRGGADRRRADLQHRHADARVGAARRAPRTAPRRPRRPRRAARPSARSGSVARCASQSAVLTTVSFPDEIAVWSRSPRRVASALTTRLPLCETSPTCPGSSAVSASPHSAAREWSATSPSQFGPQTGNACRRAARAARPRAWPRRRGERGHGGGGAARAERRRPRGSRRRRRRRLRTRSRPPRRSRPGTRRGRGGDDDRVGRATGGRRATGSTGSRGPTRGAG